MAKLDPFTVHHLLGFAFSLKAWPSNLSLECTGHFTYPLNALVCPRFAHGFIALFFGFSIERLQLPPLAYLLFSPLSSSPYSSPHDQPRPPSPVLSFLRSASFYNVSSSYSSGNGISLRLPSIKQTSLSPATYSVDLSVPLRRKTLVLAYLCTARTSPLSHSLLCCFLHFFLNLPHLSGRLYLPLCSAVQNVLLFAAHVFCKLGLRGFRHLPATSACLHLELLRRQVRTGEHR